MSYIIYNSYIIVIHVIQQLYNCHTCYIPVISLSYIIYNSYIIIIHVIQQLYHCHTASTTVISLTYMLYNSYMIVIQVLRKHSLFKRLFAGTWPCREWTALVSCFFLPYFTHASLLMSGGTLPAIRYSYSTLVGFRNPVINLHASFSSGSNLEACGDPAQNGHAYSATV